MVVKNGLKRLTKKINECTFSPTTVGYPWCLQNTDTAHFSVQLRLSVGAVQTCELSPVQTAKRTLVKQEQCDIVLFWCHISSILLDMVTLASLDPKAQQETNSPLCVMCKHMLSH